MCGRYFLELKALMDMDKQIDYLFEKELLQAGDYFPSNEVPILLWQNNKVVMNIAKWGFRAFDQRLIINARYETIEEKPLFKKAIPCIILASGFYEWNQLKQKFTFQNQEHTLMYMAGLCHYEDKQLVMTIVTTAADKIMQGIHHRMPLVLSKDDELSWLRERKIKQKAPLLQITEGYLQQSLF